jgi:dihydrofolate reductase
MRKIVVWMGMSLDGYIEGPDHDISWHQVDDELHQHMNERLAAMGAFWEGRRTYELMADFWPTADEDPASPPFVVEFARIWRDMPKIVFSRTLQSAGWKTAVRHDVDPAEIRELQAQPGGDILVGGAEITAEFERLDLVDEYHLYIHPAVVGGGTPLFKGSERPTTLQHLETSTFGNGVVLLRYGRERSSGAPAA